MSVQEVKQCIPASPTVLRRMSTRPPAATATTGSPLDIAWHHEHST